MHIPNLGLLTEDSATMHWNKGNPLEFDRIIEKYQDKIVHLLVAHEHKADLRLLRKMEFKGKPMFSIEESR